MELLELRLQNFLSFRGQCTLTLEQRGVVLVSGDNGAGKSSLTSKAIAWTLFGETTGGLKGDAVCTVDCSEETFCELHFRVGGEVHVLRRSRNPGAVELDGQR